MKVIISAFLLWLIPIVSAAQGIYFDFPKSIALPTTSNVHAISRYGGQLYFAQAGSNGIQLTFTDTSLKNVQQSVIPAGVCNDPVFAVTDNQLFLFWSAGSEGVYYSTISGGGNFTKPQLLIGQGLQQLSVCISNSSGLLTGIASGQKKALLVYFNVAASGTLTAGQTMDIPVGKDADFLRLVPGGNDRAKVYWKANKSSRLTFIDINTGGKTLGSPTTLPVPELNEPAMISAMGNQDRQLLIWKHHKNDNKWLYGVIENGQMRDEPAPLPPYLQTSQLFIPTVSDKGLLQILISGEGGNYSLVHCPLYNPANWIGDNLLPLKPDAKLRDIIIPGAHDAGMSVLTAAGGKDLSIINECNTLTQLHTIREQLEAGIRMFDLRIESYHGALYTRHAPADCMADAIAGAYGEQLYPVLLSVRHFLSTHTQEFVILSFCHFCTKGLPVSAQADSIIATLGRDIILDTKNRTIGDIPIRELGGKVLLTMEGYSFPATPVVNNAMTTSSDLAMNYRRYYAATNNLPRLLQTQQHFFDTLKTTVNKNDIVRLDWQLTEAAKEAAFICNDFESPHSNPLVDGTKALLSAVSKYKSIRDLARTANLVLTENMVNWLNNNTINRNNKPNILYVDIAGKWATDLCMFMNSQPVYDITN